MTVEGVPTVGGVFRVQDTTGIPLVFTMDWVERNGLAIDWLDYVLRALEAG